MKTEPNPRDTLYNKKLEMSVIGSLLIEPTALSAVIEIVQPSDFYLEPCQRAFEAALQLGRDGKAIDRTTLEAELIRREHWAETGSLFLSECITITETYTLAGSYATVVADWARRRKALKLATSLGKAAVSSGGLFSAELALSASALTELSKSQTKHMDTWQPFGLAEAYEPRQPRQYAVEGLLQLPGLVIAYGAPGTLKSFWLADLAICVAAGRPFLEALPGDPDTSRKVLQSPVCWLDFDNGRRRTLERFDALGKARHVPDDVPLHIFSMPSPWLDISAEESIGNLTGHIQALGAKLVVIDNLGTISGGVDENSPQMIPVMTNVRRLIEATGVVMVIIHHQRKTTGVSSRIGESLRGHSSIEAALDLALLIEREERSSLITIKGTKTRDVDVPPFGCQFTYEHDDADELAEARFWGELIQDSNSDKAITDAVVEVVSQNHPINQSNLWKEVHVRLPDVGRDRVYRVAKNMVAIRKSSGARGAILYDLTS